MINRLLANQLLDYLTQFPCVGVVGSRQVGKTTLVKRIQGMIPVDSQYIDLELPEDRARLSDPSLYLSRFADSLVIIDEVQLMPDLFPVLRALIDQDRRPGRFLLLGSASPTLLSRSGESLAGRIVYCELNPLRLDEIGTEHWENHWLKGGYPEAYLLKDAASWTWRGNFLTNYQTRDLPQLGLTASPILIGRLLRMLASINGELLNESMLSKSLGISLPTVGTYLNFLENSYLIRRLYSYTVNVRKRLVKSHKLYFRDSGLLHRLLGVQSTDDLYNSPLSGNSFEGYVVQQVIASLNDTVEPYFYRTADGSEMDLVLVKGIQPFVSIEIRRSNSPSLSRGNTISINDLGTKHNFIVTPSSGNFPFRESIEVTGLANLWQHLRMLHVLQ